MIDFTKVKPNLEPIDDKTFKISVNLKGGKTKEFIFRTLRQGLIGTWMSLITLNLTNPNIEFFRDSPASREQIPDIAPRNFWKVCHITNKELLKVA